MVSEKFCLRWNDFETNISSAFRELRDDKDFFDLTLACDDEQIQAHKVILSACSPFFKNVLSRNPHQHPLLYLKGVKFTDLLSVLHFMYHGEVNIAQDELNSFLAVAEDLRVKGLTQNQSGSSSRTPKARPPGREPAAPPKISRSTASDSLDNEDIQEVVTEKIVLREHILPAPISVIQQVPPPQTTPVKQTQQLQQMDDSLETAGQESYDEHGQYGATEGGYEAGMVDTGIEAVLDSENIGTGRDIVMGMEDEQTIDIMGNSELQTKVKEECLIEMGIKLETEDIDEKKKRERRVPGGDSLKFSCRKRSHVSSTCSTVAGGDDEGPGMADSDNISVRKKARRCCECSHCIRDNCGSCPSCQDMVRFGRSGKKLKKGCLDRICMAASESVSVEEAAKIVADYLVQEKKQEYVQYTSKAGGFKIWSSGMVLPSNIQDMLKRCTSSISSTFKDSPTKLRTRFLDKKLLEETDVENLMDLCDTFEDWVKYAFDKFKGKKERFGQEMFKEITSDADAEIRKESASVEDGMFVSDEVLSDLRPFKKVRVTRSAVPESVDREGASAGDAYVCQKDGCPSRDKDFKTRDGYTKHLKTQRHINAQSTSGGQPKRKCSPKFL